MAVNLDFGLLGQPNVLGNALQGYQAGQQAGHERRTRNALSAYAQDPSQIGSVIAEDPQLGIGLRNVDRQDAVAQRQAERERQAQHAQAAQRWASAGLNIPADPQDPANPNAPPTYNARRAALQRFVADNVGGWDDETQQTLTAAVNNPNARFDNDTLGGIMRATGGDPDAGAYTLTAAPGATSTRYAPGGREIASVHTNPEPRYQLDGAGNLVRTDSAAFSGGQYPQTMGTPTPTAGTATPSARALSATPASAPHTMRSATGPMWEQVQQAIAPLNPSPAELTFLGQTFQAESSGGRNQARNGSSQGGFQFHADTFRGVMPNGDINSLGDQAQAALTLARRNEAVFQHRFGHEPTAGELYLMHQQGTAGALALMSAPPEVGAIAALTPAYNGNATRARQAVLGNGGTADMTAAEFVDHWTHRFDGAPQNAAVAPAQQTASAPAGGPPATIGQPRPVTDHASRPMTQADATRLGLAHIIPGTVIDANGTPHWPPGANVSEEIPLDDRTVQNIALAYLADSHSLPSFGNGPVGARNRNRVLNAYSNILDATGATGADAARRWQENRSAVTTLTRVQTRRAVIEQQAGEANNTADLLLQAMPDGRNGTQPWLNRPARAFLNHTGNGGVSRFNIAVNSFAEVYARVMTGATGSASATDSARHRAHELLNPDQSPGQIEGNIRQMRLEMQGQTRSLEAAEQAARDQIRTGAGAGRQGGAASPQAVPDFTGSTSQGDAPRTLGARPAATRPAPAQTRPAATPRPSGGQLPQAAVRSLQEGHNTTFGNGQVWTLRSGRPVRVR